MKIDWSHTGHFRNHLLGCRGRAYLLSSGKYKIAATLVHKIYELIMTTNNANQCVKGNG